MSAYLRETQLQAKNAWNAKPLPGISNVRVRVMQSNGGIVSAENAAAEPVRTVLSGPPAECSALSYAAQLAGLEKVITFRYGRNLNRRRPAVRRHSHHHRVARRGSADRCTDA